MKLGRHVCGADTCEGDWLTPNVHEMLHLPHETHMIGLKSVKCCAGATKHTRFNSIEALDPTFTPPARLRSENYGF